MTLPLEGLRIVDLTAVVSGPMATQMLADQGADVVKIEPLPAGELNRLLGTRRGPVTSLYETINKGKRSVGLDLKDERGREILAQLIEGADALVENFRPGALERLGFSEARLRELQPELVFASITGFGPDGPYS
ncbi:MAG: CoA transferase, partial [Acidobacteriota bacterium]